MYRDDYGEDNDYGVYRLFRADEIEKCVKYLVDTLYERVEAIGIAAFDIRGRKPVRVSDGHSGYDVRYEYPLLGRDAAEQELLLRRNITVPVAFGECNDVTESVTLGIREVFL